MEYMHSNNGVHNAYSLAMPLDNGDCTVIMEYIMHTASLCHWIMEYMHSNNGVHNAYSFAMPLDNGVHAQ